MATIRKKYCVEAVARWIETTNFFVIMVSVTHEDGKPVTSLTNSNFKAGSYNNNENWDSFSVGSVNTEASSRGFYSFIRGDNSLNPGEIILFKSNKDFTVQVTKKLTRGDTETIYHGQCFAAKHPTEILEFA
jgi:hypothetical protein